VWTIATLTTRLAIRVAVLRFIFAIGLFARIERVDAYLIHPETVVQN